MGNRADQALGLCPEHRTPRQNGGKFKAHKWGGFTGRLDMVATSSLRAASVVDQRREFVRLCDAGGSEPAWALPTVRDPSVYRLQVACRLS
jgi:hypothetical protein